jgi:outer membrane protein assembly factor BamB
MMGDSTCLIASGGLHAVNMNSGLLWSFPSATGIKSGKPLTVSTFNENTYNKLFKVHVNTNDEGMITGLASNILLSNGVAYLATSEKLIAVSAEGKLLWEKDLKDKGVAGSVLVEDGENIILINLAIAIINNNEVVYGKPFAASYSKQSGAETFETSLAEQGSLVDIKLLGDQKMVASRSNISRVTSAGLQKVFQFSDVKFGNFLEFIDGNEYYTEKEGFFIPLNFINDKVVYFKTDNDKVYGLNSNEIEYEYHFTELYKGIGKVNDKHVISQKKKSLLISGNFEKLATFDPADKVISFNDRVYFINGSNIHIVDVEHLK